MKNLAQFKRKLSETLNNGGTVDFTRHAETAFSDHHPMAKLFPDGIKVETVTERGCKIGRVQSSSFARINNQGKESWLDYGQAGHWKFPDENTAVYTDEHDSTDHIYVLTLTYKF